MILHAVFFLGAMIVFFVTFAEGAHVHHENMHFGIGFVFLRHDRFFGGIHAAHGRTIIMGLIARADALQEGDLLRFCVI